VIVARTGATDRATTSGRALDATNNATTESPSTGSPDHPSLPKTNE
jgi:hypothetical protein